MKKKVLLFILTLMPFMVIADPVEIDGISYNLIAKGKVAEVTRNFNRSYSGNVIIPEKVSYGGVDYDVTSIGGDVSYNGNSYLGGAFRGCTGLTSVTIPNSVTSIGYGAFYGCSGLTSVAIPESVTSIGESAFSGCSGLTSINIPNSATSIGESAFSGCSGLTSITIPSSWSSIGNGVFGGCSSLTSIIIPDNINSIGDCAFLGCTGLTSITIPNSVYSIGKQAFQSCGFTSVNIPSSVSYIGKGAFLFCRALTSINIPENVTSIGSGTFYGCTKLTSITIPQSVTSIGGDDRLGGAFGDCSGLTTIIIPNSVTSIGNQAFLGCSNLKTVKIGSGMKSIGSYAFMNCSELTDVYCYPENVPSTNSEVFKNSYIEYATLHVPESALEAYKAKIPWRNFKSIVATNSQIYTLTYLVDGEIYRTLKYEEGESITPEAVPIKEGYSFSGWSEIPETMPAHDIMVTGAFTKIILFNDIVVKALCLANWDVNRDEKLGIDEAASVTSLGSVFANNTDITSFDELQHFTGLTSIGEQAFYYCSNLKSIIIPENVTTIENRAFYVCSGLKSLRIPANVSNIEDRAFAYCSGLETIEVDENNQYYDSRNSCNALIQTSSNTLLVGCKNSVIPDGVTSIAEGAFRGCTELTNIVIPEGVKTIGASAFRGCTGLTSVSLPSTITSIGNYAFSAFDEVYNLTTVSVGMTSPVAIASEVFPNRANSILYVPKGSRPAYKAANYWKEFKQIIELEDGVPVKCEKPTITFFASGKIKVESATEGAKCITNIIASNVEPLTDGDISLNTPLTIYTVKAYATAEGYADSDEATATFRYEKTNGDMNGDGTVNIADVVQLVNMILGN